MWYVVVIFSSLNKMALCNGDADTSRIVGEPFRRMVRIGESMNELLKSCLCALWVRAIRSARWQAHAAALPER
jgi:hypothetical protein